MRRTEGPRAWALAAGCAALLAACGGGGDSAPADTTVHASAGSDINATNYQGFANSLVSMLRDIGLGGSVSDTFGALARVQASSLVRRTLLMAADEGRASVQAAGHQTVHPRTSPCDYAGTLSVTWNDANDTYRLDGGDTFTVNMTNCQFAAGYLPESGGYTLTVQQWQTDAQGNFRSAQVTGSILSWSIGSYSLNGGFQFSLAINADSSETLQMAFNNLVGSRTGGHNLTYNTTLKSYTSPTGSSSFSIDGTIKAGEETYLLEQMQNFATAPDRFYPLSGSARLKDAAGDALVLEARSADQVDFKFYPAGSTTPTQQWLNQLWRNLGD